MISPKVLSDQRLINGRLKWSDVQSDMYNSACSVSSVTTAHTHMGSRKCSLINTPLSGIPAGTADPSPVWAERLHNPFEREKYGGLLGDISFPPRQQVLCVQGYWTLQTIYYPECLRCGFELQMPSSAGKLLVRQRRASVVLRSQCCWDCDVAVQFTEDLLSWNQPVDCYVCLDKQPVSQNDEAVKTGLRNVSSLSWFSVKCG